MSFFRAPPQPLQNLTTAIFAAAGCAADEAQVVADHLVQANLTGHDSHGVIRAPTYVRWLAEGKVLANQRLKVLFENDTLAVVDGQLGLGQSIAQQAIQLGIAKASRGGVAVVSLRNSGHVGRVGHWAEMAVAAGLVSLHFVNTSGLGLLVAPVGGISRRLSANPVAAGIPVAGGEPIIYDISTASVAEGKLKVAFNKGVSVPEGCIIDAAGNPTRDPRVFYADPPGAILPFGGHKGYGLGIVAEILAGALTGGGCSAPGKTRLEQGMLSILLDPCVFQVGDHFLDDVRRFLDFVKSAEKANPTAEILVPGDVERRHRAERGARGIELDDNTWRELADCAQSLAVPAQLLAACRASS
ncbi:MAG: malate/lactate/ureidoglycolate dehydrogenase [Pirellulaceae bacterium]|nr:malate/lactate/ureidoglycolate dehydrogenase [Pirellulaceae bacterium]